MQGPDHAGHVAPHAAPMQVDKVYLPWNVDVLGLAWFGACSMIVWVVCSKWVLACCIILLRLHCVLAPLSFDLFLVGLCSNLGLFHSSVVLL